MVGEVVVDLRVHGAEGIKRKRRIHLLHRPPNHHHRRARFLEGAHIEVERCRHSVLFEGTIEGWIDGVVDVGVFGIAGNADDLGVKLHLVAAAIAHHAAQAGAWRAAEVAGEGFR